MEPPTGLDEIVETFGDCHDPGFEKKNIILFDLPYPLVYGRGTKVWRGRCHRLLEPVFTATLSDIKRLGLSEFAQHYGGIYCYRLMRGRKYPSTHSWGISIDINPQENQLGTPGTMHPDVIGVFKANGFTWGGDFKSRKDPMHFQFARAY